jgi:hypothetical protein
VKSVGDLKSVSFKQAFGMLVPVVLFLILPQFGAHAMMVGAAAGMVIFSIVYRESMHGQHGTYTTVLCLTAATVLGSVLAVAFGR